MSVALPARPAEPIEHQIVFEGVKWESYVDLNDSVPERHNPRLIYVDGRLTILTSSRTHDWYGERLAEFVKKLAEELDILWEDAGSATYRRKNKRAGVEGDRTFYLGAHAEMMRGPRNINLAVQPPPDLAIEVEVSRSADDAVLVWGRLGVPEVWRFDPIAHEASFCLRNRHGTCDPVERSVAFPVLILKDLVEQMRLAERLGAARWNSQLTRWIRKIIKRETR
jgi:Uma2 family endonuclease